MKTLIVICLLLSGCTVSVVDQRLTREEVAQAFQQRDQIITGLLQDVKALKEGKKK